jgi:hypothetical protein
VKRFAMLVGIALAVGIGSAAMACEDGIYAADEPTVTTPQQACATDNCTVPKPTVQSTNSRCPSNSCQVSRPQQPTHSGPAQPTPQLACGSSRSCGCCW